RSMLGWEWWGDHNTSRLFIYLLLMANHEDNRWQGQEVKRGQRITSLGKLASETGLSVKQVRLALNKLKETGELTIKTTSQYSLITICNYDKYQGRDSQEGKP